MKQLDTQKEKAGRMSWTVYMLECADGSLYTGITIDLARRITEHEQGNGARYTKGRGPFCLVHKECFDNRAEASKREVSIKALSRGKKLALILRGGIADHGL